MTDTNAVECDWDIDPFAGQDWSKLTVEEAFAIKVALLKHIEAFDAHMLVCPVRDSAQSIREARTYRCLLQDVPILHAIVLGISQRDSVEEDFDMTLTLQQANTIIENAFKAAGEMKINPLGVVVLDASGHIVAAQRQDRASFFRLDVALGKAYAAVAMGASSRALWKRSQGNPNFFVTLAATANGKFLPQTGAALIRDASGNIIGSAGASGGTGDEDEACCVKGIEAAGLVADASE